MHDYLWLHDKVNRFEMAWAICASLLFHVLLVLILTTTSSYYPAIGTVPRFDVLWVAQSSVPLDFPATAGVSSPHEPAGLPQETVISERLQPEGRTGPISTPPPLFADSGKDELAAARQPQDLDEDDETVVSMVTRKVTAQPEKPHAAPKGTALVDKAEGPEKKRKVSGQQGPRVPIPTGITLAQLRQVGPSQRSRAAVKAETQRLADLPDEQKRIAQDKADRLSSKALDNEQARQSAEEYDLEAEQERLSDEQEEDHHQEAQQAPLDKTERERISELTRLSQEQEEVHRQATQRARLEKIEREKTEREIISEQARLSREQEERTRQADRRARLEKAERERADRARISALKLERERRAAAVAEKKHLQTRLAASQKAREQEIPGSQGVPHPRQQEVRLAQKPSGLFPASRVAAGGDNPAIVDRKPAEPAAKEKVGPKPSEKPLEARGLVIASMRGDLKLVIAGDTRIKLSVKFREYPKSRRSRVLTRSEARRVQTILPVLAKTREETREAVIETAREGIYVFSVESEERKGAKATFTLKVFESGTREKIAALGARTIAGKTVLVRILMPEAILWDDESAFSGNLEDSESVTKFNTATGLYWKEFND